MPAPAPKEPEDDPENVNDRGARGGRGGPTDEGRGVARRLLQKFRGRAEEALAQMADEAKELRIERRELREKLKGVEGPDVVVLKGDDLKAFNDYKALGKLDELKKQLGEELPALRAKVAVSDRRTSAQDAAKLIPGWNPEALAGLAIDKGLDITLVDGTDKDGKAVKIPHVKVASDATAKPIAATEWAKTQPEYVMAALTAKPATAASASTGRAAPTGTTGVQMIDQSAGTAPGTATKAIPGRPVYQTPGQRAAASGNQK